MLIKSDLPNIFMPGLIINYAMNLVCVCARVCACMCVYVCVCECVCNVCEHEWVCVCDIHQHCVKL